MEGMFIFKSLMRGFLINSLNKLKKKEHLFSFYKKC